MLGIEEFLPTHSPPYTQEPRCSAKCPWNSGRTKPISTSERTRTRWVLADCSQRLFGANPANDNTAALRTNCRREWTRVFKAELLLQETGYPEGWFISQMSSSVKNL